MKIVQLLLVPAVALVIPSFTLFREYRGWLAIEYTPEVARRARYPLVIWVNPIFPIVAAALCIGLLVPNIPPFPVLDVDRWQWVAAGLLTLSVAIQVYARTGRAWGPDPDILNSITRQLKKGISPGRAGKGAGTRQNGQRKECLDIYVRLARNRREKNDAAGWRAVLSGFGEFVKAYSDQPTTDRDEIEQLLANALRELDGSLTYGEEIELAMVGCYRHLAHSARDAAMSRLEAQAVAGLVARATPTRSERGHRVVRSASEALAEVLIVCVEKKPESLSVSLLDQVFLSVRQLDLSDKSSIRWVRSCVELGTLVGMAAVENVRKDAVRVVVRFLAEIALEAERNQHPEIVGVSFAKLGQLADALATNRLDDRLSIIQLLQQGILRAIAAQPSNMGQVAFVQHAAAGALLRVLRSCPRAELGTALLLEVRSHRHLEILADTLESRIGAVIDREA